MQYREPAEHSEGAIFLMTMVQEIEQLLGEYRTWLKDKTVVRQINGEWVEITTPYLDRHNDLLQIYAKQENGGYVLTDDSYTVHDLEASGCGLNTEKRRDLLMMTLNGFGIKLNADALEVHASPENFPLRKHNLIQAMLAVSDLFYLAKSVVESLFYEDVVTWLDSKDIRYTPKVKFTGTGGFDHLFDFVVPKSRKQPERILQAINRPTRETAESLTFAWLDTRQVRPLESRAYAILNDTDQTISGSVLDAFRSYQIKPVLFSHREDVVAELAA
jgi:hypothetical protein